MIQTIQSALHKCIDDLNNAGIDNERFEARLLVGHVLDVDTHILVAYPEREISAANFDQIEKLLARRLKREPMSHILESREFWSLEFKVTKDTLTPRPDSETLIEATLSQFPDQNRPLRVLDLGVGTGCLILSVLHEYPKATGLGIDASEKALSVASENAANLNLVDRVKFELGNWADGVDEKFDLIISNPPYIAEIDRNSLEPEVKDYEPSSALFAGPNGMDDYAYLAKEFPRLLKTGGKCILELGVGQAESVSKLIRDAGLSVIDARKDLGGIVRCLIIQ